jgi:MATE family multidrug resistance protein
MAEGFLRILTLGCPGVALFECGKRYLQAQGHFAAGLYTFIVCIPTQVLLTWYLVKYLDFGIQGIALSLSFTRNLLPIGLFIYAKVCTSGDCWRPLDRQIFNNWSSMLKLALPSLLMLEADCIGFEVMTIMAGRFGTAELGAQTLTVTLCGFIYKTPLSLGIAAGTEIAQRLGEASARKARQAARISIVLATFIAWAVFLALLLFKQHLPWILTDDKSIIALMREILPIIAVFQFVDAYVGVMNGIIRGIGKQAFGAWVQLVGCYAVGLPVSGYTAFGLDWRLKGLWTGIALAMVFVCIVQGLYLWKVDWRRLVDDARHRNDGEHEYDTSP